MWKGQVTLRDADAVRDRLPGHVPVRRPVRRHAGQPAARLPRHRLVLRGRALPLRAVRHHRVRHLRRHLLLVPEDDRPDAGRAARQVALLADVHRLPHHVPGPALAGQRGHAAPVRRLPADRRVHHAEHDLHDRRVRPRRLDAAVHLERLQVATGTARSSRSTTRGATATRWSGRPVCPPPRHNFTALPRIRSERPAFELHYPHMVERMRAEAHVGPGPRQQEPPRSSRTRTEPQ